MVLDSNFESVNSTDNIKEILDEVYYSENINECRKKEILIYENEYIISKNEAYEGLKNSGMIKTAGTRIVIYTVILLLAIAGFIAAYVIRNNINDLIFSFISLAVLVIIWLIPHFSLDKLAKVNANGNVIKFKVYDRSLQIFCNNNSWYIPLDNSNRMKLCKNVIIIKRIKDNQLFVIPLRAIEDDKTEAVLEVLKKGTLTLGNN